MGCRRRKTRGETGGFFWFFAEVRGRTPHAPVHSPRRMHVASGWRRRCSDGRARAFGVHPRCSDRSSAFGKEGPLARPVYLSGLRPLSCAELASRVDTEDSPDTRGGVSGESTRPKTAAAAGGIASPHHTPRISARSFVTSGEFLGRHPTALRASLAQATADARRSPTTRPHRPGGSLVSTLEASSAQVSGRRPIRNMGRGSGLPLRTRRTCLSSEGGHQGPMRSVLMHSALATRCSWTPGRARGNRSRRAETSVAPGNP
ncbi:hypothetical protein FHS47_003884 [Lutibacter sp. SG786]|nr:hypothetical protein [Luteibacter sp. SG786]